MNDVILPIDEPKHPDWHIPPERIAEIKKQAELAQPEESPNER